MSDGTGAVIGAPRLAPDLALLAYLGGSRLGAVAYNALHTYLGPAVVVAICQGTRIGTSVALIWAAHIGMDRALGFGLKYASGFRVTHLGAMGGGGNSRRAG